MDQPSNTPTDNLLGAVPPSRKPSTMHTIFIGPYGLRAGWRLAIFALIVYGLIELLSLMAKLFHGSVGGGASALTPLGTGISAGFGFLLTAIAAWVMSRIEGRKFGQYGLPAKNAFGKDLRV